MPGPTPRGAYSDTFAYEPTTARERGAAAGIAIALLLGTALLAPVAHRAGPVIAAVVSACDAVAIVGAALTAWMFVSQYRVRPHAPLAVVGIAYGVFAALQLGHLVAFPGVSVPLGRGDAPQVAGYFGLASYLGFLGFSCWFVVLERGRAHGARWNAAIVRRTAAVAVAFVGLVVLIVNLARHALAPIVGRGGEYSAFAHLAAPALGVFSLALGVVVYSTSGTSRRIHLWLGVVLLAIGLEIFDGAVLGGARFTEGWYASNAGNAGSAFLLFCVMQAQLASIMRRSARNGERALALQEIASVGTESGPEQNRALLERAAFDLDFDWACLAQVEDGWVTLECSVGDSPYPDQFRAPAGEAWLRHALKGPDLTFHEAGDGAPWIEEGPTVFRGWSLLVTLPIFIEEHLYGVVAYANTMPRRVALGESDRAFLRLVGKVLGGMIDRRRQRRQLDRLAYNDALTGLPNRAMLLSTLQKELAASQRYDRQFALHFLDLDGFKAVNDAVGHLAGDEVLREAARRIGDSVRAADTVARLGGDEFVVLQPNVHDLGETLRLQTRLRKAFESPIDYGGQAFRIGVSIGTSRFPQDGTDIYGLLDRADVELYRVKARRRKNQARG